MREINVKTISEAVFRLCIDANRLLPEDVRNALYDAKNSEPWPTAQGVLVGTVDYAVTQWGFLCRERLLYFGTISSGYSLAMLFTRSVTSL